MIPDLSTATWRKSSHSGGNGGECVELALAGEFGAARDSKNAEGDVLVFGVDALACFLDAAKNGHF
jgi:hypothetical protein